MSDDNVINLADRRKQSIAASEDVIREEDYDEVFLVRLYFKEKTFSAVDLAIEKSTDRVLGVEDFERISWATWKAQHFITEKMLALKGEAYTTGEPVRMVYGINVYGNSYTQTFASVDLMPDPQHLGFIDKTLAGSREMIYEIIMENSESLWPIQEDREPSPDTNFEDYPGSPSNYDERVREFGPVRKEALTAKPVGSLT